MSIPVCGKLQGAVVVIMYVYTCLWQIKGGSGGNHVCLYLFVANYRGAVVVIMYVYTCLWQITGGSDGNLVCLCLFVANYRGQWW